MYRKRILEDWESFTPLPPDKYKPWIPKNPEVVWPYMPQVIKAKLSHNF